MKKLAIGMASIFAVGMIQANAADIEGYGHVISVAEKTDQVNEPRQECTTENVQVHKERGVAGSIVGGILGGVVGHQVGNGRGQTAATLAGAVGGAIAGDQVQNRNNQTTKEVQNCRTVDDYHTKVTGYLVTYQFKGGTYTDLMPVRPKGDRIRVRAHITPEI